MKIPKPRFRFDANGEFWKGLRIWQDKPWFDFRIVAIDFYPPPRMNVIFAIYFYNLFLQFIFAIYFCNLFLQFIFGNFHLRYVIGNINDY